MQGRAGQVRKLVVADQFDAFLLAYTHGARGWRHAVPDDVVDFFCYLDSQSRGNTLVHDYACPGVAPLTTLAAARARRARNATPRSRCGKAISLN